MADLILPSPPADTDEHIFVRRAVDIVGLRLFGEAWQPAPEPPERKTSQKTLADVGKEVSGLLSERDEWLRREGQRHGLRRGILKLIAYSCSVGALRTFLLPLDGTVSKPLPPEKWRLAGSDAAIVSGLMKWSVPFSGTLPHRESQPDFSDWGYVVVNRVSLERSVSVTDAMPMKVRLGTQGRPSEAANIVACGNRLIQAGLLVIDPNVLSRRGAKQAFAAQLIEVYDAQGGVGAPTPKSLKATRAFKKMWSELAEKSAENSAGNKAQA